MTSGSTSNRSRRLAAAFAALAAAALAVGGPRPAAAVDEEGCTGCHGLSGLSVREGAAARMLGVPLERFEASAHGELGCRECHLDIVSIPHGEGARSVGCGQSCHGLSVGGREFSHEALYWEHAASAHGGQGAARVSCLLCHPEPAVSEEGRDKVAEARRCASCHRANPRVRAWFSDRHFLALAAGNDQAPSCPDCHTAHRVRPRGVPESTVSAAGLADTCAGGALRPGGRGCHGPVAPGTLAAASMTPLPQSRGRGLGALFSLLVAALLAGLVARAGIGLVRGR